MGKYNNNKNSNYNNNRNNNNNNQEHTPVTNGVEVGFSSNIKSSAGDGKPGFWINGWNWSKTRGTIKLSGVENKRSKRYKGKQNGKQHIMLFVEVFYVRTGSTVLEYIDFCVDSGTATLPKLGMFINTKGKKGGSWTNLVNPKNYK